MALSFMSFVSRGDGVNPPPAGKYAVVSVDVGVTEDEDTYDSDICVADEDCHTQGLGASRVGVCNPSEPPP